MSSFLYFSQLLANRGKKRPLAMAEDPWGGRGEKPQGSPEKEPGPPDLDEFFKKLLGGRRDKRADDEHGGGGNGGGRPPVDMRVSPKLIAVAIAAAAVLWLASGFYTVKERENGVETVLGRYTATTKSGLNWNWPAPIGHVNKVDVQSISTMRIGEFRTQKGSVSTQDQRVGQMLTKDENIVEIGAALQYRISDPRAYEFNAENPVGVLNDIVTSAIREVVGANTVDDVLTNRRNEWPQEARQIIIDTVKQYDLGIEVVALELQDARVPAEVQDAFEDAVRAREDEERLRLQAEAYANERLPIARGEAQKRVQAAKAYAVAAVAQAEAEATRFNDLLAAYNKDKTALRKRVYLETMSDVYSQNRKVVMDSGVKPIISMDSAAPVPAVQAAAEQDASAAAERPKAAPASVQPAASTAAAPESASEEARSRSRSRGR